MKNEKESISVQVYLVPFFGSSTENQVINNKWINSARLILEEKHSIWVRINAEYLNNAYRNANAVHVFAWAPRNSSWWWHFDYCTQIYFVKEKLVWTEFVPYYSWAFKKLLAMTVRYRIYLHQINPQQICPCWEKWCPWHQHRRKENLTFHVEVAWVKPKPWRDERHSDGDQRRKKNQWRWPPSRPQNLNFFFFVHETKAGFLVVWNILPPYWQRKSFMTATRSLKHNFNFLFL